MVKRQCPEGTSCKYIHENQHTGEFNHDNAPLPKQHDWGNGNGSSSLSSRSYSLSSGSSSTLGGSKRGASGLLNQPVPKRKPRPKKAPDQNAVIELLSSDDEVDFMTKGATKAVKRKKARKSFDGVVDLCESSEEEQVSLPNMHKKSEGILDGSVMSCYYNATGRIHTHRVRPHKRSR